MVSWKDHETGRWRTASGYTDKTLSLKKGERLEAESARRAEGQDDPFETHRWRPIAEHVEAYLSTQVANRGGAPRYILQIENRLNRVIDGIRARHLGDLDPVAVMQFLNGLRLKGKPLSSSTLNEYIDAVKAFTRWAMEVRRVDRDPLMSLKRLQRSASPPKHPRAAMLPHQMGLLLDAAVRRPVVEVQTVRRGKNRDKPLAKVRPRVLAAMRAKGLERRVVYLLAFWTGLRRSEIKALQWGDVILDTATPHLRLRAQATKSRRPDQLVIHHQLAEELRRHRPANARHQDRVVTTVPDMKTFRADLRFAGIDPGDHEAGFVDLHALRMSVNTTMAAGGMSQRARQAHMRHKDPRLTENTYMDERLLPIAAELAKLPAIPDPADQPPAALPFEPEDGARNAHETGATAGHSVAQPGTTAEDSEEKASEDVAGQIGVNPAETLLPAPMDTARHLLAPGRLKSG